jgi:hypothetical protein
MRTNFKDYLSQGKSNNYLQSEATGKWKAGEAAQFLSKKFKTKIYAKELHVFSSEWHHAGVFKGGSGKLTGRHVYFLTPTQTDKITLEELLRNRAIDAEARASASEKVQGWFVQFVKGPKNAYGKRKWVPLLGVYRGPKGEAPKTFVALDDHTYADALTYQGRQLKPYARTYNEVLPTR